MINEYIYSDELVSISASAAVLEGTHYSIAAISELFILDRRPDRQCQPTALSPIFSVLYCAGVFAAAGLLATYSCQMSGLNIGPSLASFFTGAALSIVLFIFVVWLADRMTDQKPKDFEQNPPDYVLVIGTRTGHRFAISSHHRWYIERIEGCIEYAMSLSAKARKKSVNLCSVD